MKVYLAPIIIIALIILAIVFFVSCSSGFRGSIGSAEPAGEASTRTLV